MNLSEIKNSIPGVKYIPCVIVNDGSTDNTEVVAKSYVNKDVRFKYLYQDNSGVSAARNNGIRHSNGFFILPLDSDNMLLPTYMEKAVSYFLLHPETTLVYGKAELFGDKNGIWNLPEYSWEKFIWSMRKICPRTGLRLFA